MGFDIAVLDTWDQQSEDPNVRGRMHENHESSVSRDEVLRLTKEGVDLLLRQPLSAIQASKDKALRKAWDDVQQGKSRLCIVRVWKGIHQKRNKPHLTARVVGGATLHLWLSAKDTNMASLPGFTYSVVAVSATEKGGIVPNVALAGIRRRGSMDLSLMVSEQRRMAESASAAAQEGQARIDLLASV